MTAPWFAALLQRLLKGRFVVTCQHDWQYDAEESAGPCTGYIERCAKCGAITQVPM